MKTDGRLPASRGARSESAVALREKDGTILDANDAVRRKLDEAIQNTLTAQAQLRPFGQCNGVYKDAAQTISCELGLAAQSLVLQQKDAAEDHLVGASIFDKTGVVWRLRARTRCARKGERRHL